jgi:hypothetical protein
MGRSEVVAVVVVFGLKLDDEEVLVFEEEDEDEDEVEEEEAELAVLDEEEERVMGEVVEEADAEVTEIVVAVFMVEVLVLVDGGEDTGGVETELKLDDEAEKVCLDKKMNEDGPM